jgi:hypothetical protein
MVHILPLEATSSSASQAIFCVFWKPKIRNHFHKSPKGPSILYRDSSTVRQTLGICSRCRGAANLDDYDDNDDDDLFNDSEISYIFN